MKKLLILLLLCGTASADLVSYFNGQFIPVEKIEVYGNTVTAHYNMDLMLGAEEFRADIPYVFGRLAKEYPESQEIRIICYAGGSPVYDYSAKTLDIESYGLGYYSDEEMKEKITLEEHKDDTALLLLLGGGVILLLGAASILVVGAAYILHRKWKKKKT